jgi:hypothetical protein
MMFGARHPRSSHPFPREEVAKNLFSATFFRRYLYGLFGGGIIISVVTSILTEDPSVGLNPPPDIPHLDTFTPGDGGNSSVSLILFLSMLIAPMLIIFCLLYNLPTVSSVLTDYSVHLQEDVPVVWGGELSEFRFPSLLELID